MIDVLLRFSIHNQTTAVVRIFKGDRALARANEFMAELRLVGLAISPNNKPEVVVSIEMHDIDGSLTIKAEELRRYVSLADRLRLKSPY